ncbi:MAG: asparagine synthetase B [Methanobrevibacter sp.]|uniref:asparagine synthetase B n=1 Tax=Methanobrevibacter sp. TaxID=66852 RepID=UPI0025E1699E|nr:asparagine synthetase B [Methanobrevibacter sp.]MBR0270425.1 asparagine synthetase B [Methanobrevibacter sp.]
MSSIVGLQGKFSGNDLIKMLKASKMRGPDSSGIYLDEIVHGIDLDSFDDEKEYDIAFGHNLLCVYDIHDRKSSPQPISKDNLVLTFDGALYNFGTIRNFLNKVGVEGEITSDAEALINLIDFYNNGDLLKAVQSAVHLIDGDYAFSVWDGENLAIARDPLGVKPLFYAVGDDLCAFASSRDSLNELGFDEIQTLLPENILFNWDDVAPTQYIYEKIMEVDASKLDKLLKLSVSKRVEGLDKLGVIFSGGVDSSILAMLLEEISCNKRLDITLYAVGSENSKDLEAARYAAEYLDLPLKTQIITPELIRKHLGEVVHAIGDDNLMKIGVGLTAYFASRMIHEDKLNVAISGQGADELFGGYNRYLKSYEEGDLEFEIRQDISNMYHVNLERDDACTMLNSVEIRLPFLDKSLVEYAINLPVKNKISGSGDVLRKNILRKFAFNEGLDKEIAYRPKKAAQYGTGIDKILRKKIIPEIDLKEFL